MKVGTQDTGSLIPADYLGLSFETSNLFPRPDGEHLFGPANARLIAIFRTLGIKSLRVGGGTADMPRYAVPGEKDIDNLFAFAAAADVKVIYTLRFPGIDADRDAAIAKYIEERYPTQLTCFEIGNEPDFYRRVYREIPDYATYRTGWKRIAEAVTQQAPGAKFCGPASGGSTAWSRSFADDFAASGLIAAIAQHDYPGGDGAHASGAVARDQMLSRAWIEHYDQLYNAFAVAALSQGLPYRLEETNNFTGGAKDATDTFTASLWALDYLHWWAAHRAAGMNFHNRRWILNTTIYPVAERDDGVKSGYNLHPIAYGIKAFDLGGHGAVAPVAIVNPDAINLTAYAVRDPENLFVTVINKKDPGDSPHPADVTILAEAISNRAAVMLLTAPNGDVSVKTGITLGGAPMDNGSWDGKWTPLKSAKAGQCTLKLPGASAAVVRLSLARAGRPSVK